MIDETWQPAGIAGLSIVAREEPPLICGHRSRTGTREIQRAMIRRFIRNWIPRHQNRVNFWLHMVGIPLGYIGGAVALLLQSWMWFGILFVGGYVLQFIGHAIEGNDVGELIPIKRALGLPTVDIAPQYKAGS